MVMKMQEIFGIAKNSGGMNSQLQIKTIYKGGHFRLIT